jgi:hypothetical protein
MKANEGPHAGELVASCTTASSQCAPQALLGGVRALLQRRPARLGKAELFEVLFDTMSDLFDAQIRAAEGDGNGATRAYARAAERLAATTDRYRDRQAPRLAPPPVGDEHAGMDVEELTVDREAAWFRVGSDRIVDCRRHRNVRVALLMLIEAHATPDAAVVSWHQLVARLWPGESVVPRAAKNRVRVTIAHLRRLGLGGLIVTEGDGYRLDGRVLVRVIDE